MSTQHLPDEGQIEKLLSDIQLEPGRKLEKRLSSAPWTPRAVARRRGIAVLSLAVLAAAVLIASTPSGRAWANQFFHFFPPATSTSFPASTKDMQSALMPGQTTVPTFEVRLQPVTDWMRMNLLGYVPMSMPLPLAGCDAPEAFISFACQAANAQAVAGFQPKHLPGDTADWFFRGAWGTRDPQQIIWFNYSAVSSLGTPANLYIRQGSGDFPVESQWSAVPTEAVQAVHVGDYPAEYVKGTFELISGDTTATWSSAGDSQRLRWKEGERWFEIGESGAYWLEQPGLQRLVALAASMTDAPDYRRGINPNDLTGIRDAETLTGIDLLEPGLLPEGFHLANARYDARYQELHMAYLFPEHLYQSHAAGVVVIETPLKAAPAGRLPEAYPADVARPAQLGEGTGVYILAPSKQPWTLYDSFTVWTPQVPQLVWRQNGLLIEMFYYPVPEYGGRLSEADMLAIAKSFR